MSPHCQVHELELLRLRAALLEISRAAPGLHQVDPCYGRIRALKEIARAALLSDESAADAIPKNEEGRLMFHLRDGFYFERLENGAVLIVVAQRNPGPVLRELTVPAAEWASALAAVSPDGYTGESYAVALAFHEHGTAAVRKAGAGDAIPSGGVEQLEADAKELAVWASDGGQINTPDRLAVFLRVAGPAPDLPPPAAELTQIYAERHRLRALARLHKLTDDQNRILAFTEALIGLDSLLAGAWGSLDDLGGGKLQIQRANGVLLQSWREQEMRRRRAWRLENRARGAPKS
jgi:hypothetical protein